MNCDERLKKASDDFSLLSWEQQDYVLGIMQALVFAKDTNISSESSTTESVPQGNE